MIAVKMMLAHGHYLSISMTLREAEGLIDQWKIAQSGSDILLSGTCSTTSIKWFVRVKDVLAIHTYDVEQLRMAHLASQAQLADVRQKLGLSTAPNFMRGSGLG